MASDSQALTRDAINAAQDLCLERVEIPEWKGHAFIRVVTIAERVELEQRSSGFQGSDVLANIVAYSLCDAGGVRLFQTDEEIAALKAKNANVIQRLSKRCARLNAITPKDVEEIAKNSDAARSSDTSSASPNG